MAKDTSNTDRSPREEEYDSLTILLTLLAANGALFLFPLLLSFTAPLLATEIRWLFGDKTEAVELALSANFVGVLALSFFFLLWVMELLFGPFH